MKGKLSLQIHFFHWNFMGSFRYRETLVEMINVGVLDLHISICRSNKCMQTIGKC